MFQIVCALVLEVPSVLLDLESFQMLFWPANHGDIWTMVVGFCKCLSSDSTVAYVLDMFPVGASRCYRWSAIAAGFSHSQWLPGGGLVFARLPDGVKPTFRDQWYAGHSAWISSIRSVVAHFVRQELKTSGSSVTKRLPPWNTLLILALITLRESYPPKSWSTPDSSSLVAPYTLWWVQVTMV